MAAVVTMVIKMMVFEKTTLEKEDIRQLRCALRRVVNSKIYPRFQRYTLLEKLDCEAPEECFHAVVSSVGIPFFLRTFPRESLTLATTRWLRTYLEYYREERVWNGALEFFHEVGIVGDRGFIVSEYIPGASLDDLTRYSVSSTRPFSWPMAMMLFCAGLVAVFALHKIGLVHGRIRPQSIRVTVQGEVFLCCGLPCADERSNGERDDDIVALGRAVLPFGAGPRTAQVRELFARQERQAFTVLSDLIIEEHPELTDLAVAVLRPVGLIGGQLSVEEATALMKDQIINRVASDERHQLLRAVAECSPDFQGQHRDLAI